MDYIEEVDKLKSSLYLVPVVFDDIEGTRHADM